MTTGVVKADGYIFTPNYLTKEVAAGAYVLNNNIYSAVANGTTLTKDNTYYTSNAGAGEFKSNGTEVADGTNYFEVTKGAGSSFDVTSAATAGVPFRPYFTKDPSNSVKETRSIVFNSLNTQFGGEADPGQGEATNEGLLVSAKRKHIYVTSAYNSEVKVTIVNTAGAVINTFSLQPGETMETQVASGVYLVNKIKIAVK